MFLFTFLFFFVIACARVPVDPAKTQTLIFNSYMEPEYLDPGYSADSASNMIVNQLFEGLTTLDSATLDVKPGIAKSWEVSPDGLRYTFFLREDTKWSDGSPLTAEDFLFAWKRVLEPSSSSRYLTQLFVIKNARAWHEGTMHDAAALGMKVLDAHTLQVELEHPLSYFPQLVSWYTFRPVKRALVEQLERKWTQPEFMVCNGPFKLTEWIPQKRIVLMPNEHYWDAQQVHLQKIIFALTEDQETALKRYLNSEVHVLTDPPWLKIPELRKRSDFHESPLLVTYYLVANTKARPLDRKLFRQALSLALDRQKLVELSHKGEAAQSLVPPGIDGYTVQPGFTFNPQKARLLLLQSGFLQMAEKPKITLLYNTSENQKMLMESVQNMWQQNLGVHVDLLNMEWKVLLKTLKAHDFVLSRRAWVADYADPSTFLETFLSDSPQNYSDWHNARFDALIHQAQVNQNNAERMQLFAEAEQILLDEQPLMPLFHYTQTWLVHPKLRGLLQNRLGMIFLKDAEFTDK